MKKHELDKRSISNPSTNLPPFTSSIEEIKIAVERNAIDRGKLLIKVLVSQEIDSILERIEKQAATYDKEDYFEFAEESGLGDAIFQRLESTSPPTPYPYYFCLPQQLINSPRLIFYYRNIAMLSLKVMRGIGMGTEAYEAEELALPQSLAHDLAAYFNEIISGLIKAGGISPSRHIIMMMANLGDSLGGISRNEVGRVAMVRILNPLIHFLHKNNQLAAINYSLKGQIVTGNVSGKVKNKRVNLEQSTNIETLLKNLEEWRVIYHSIELLNGNKLLLNRQIKWSDGQTEYKIGPDLYSEVGEIDLFWAGELKGGADPAGSDEHWKTATQTLDRIINAAEKTGRDKPKLSFIATILVERVAREAQDWIDQGKLTSVYNLTQMYEYPAIMERFLDDMESFLGGVRNG